MASPDKFLKNKGLDSDAKTILRFLTDQLGENKEGIGSWVIGDNMKDLDTSKVSVQWKSEGKPVPKAAAQLLKPASVAADSALYVFAPVTIGSIIGAVAFGFDSIAKQLKNHGEPLIPGTRGLDFVSPGILFHG